MYIKNNKTTYDLNVKLVSIDIKFEININNPQVSIRINKKTHPNVNRHDQFFWIIIEIWVENTLSVYTNILYSTYINEV